MEEEDSPWGAPVSFPAPALASVRDHSPPLSTPTRASWGIDDADADGGWGHSTDGAFVDEPTFARHRDQDELEPVPTSPPLGDSWGAPTATVTTTKHPVTFDTTHAEAPAPSAEEISGASPPVHSPSLAAEGRDSFADDQGLDESIEPVHSEENDRGWRPCTPPLPPIQSLEISSATSRATWEPPSLDDEEGESAPPPLPSVDDLFGKQQFERKESVGDGEEAWGSARGWEERRIQEEAREQVQDDFDEEEEEEVTEEERREIERKVREAEEAAERGEDNWGTTTAGSEHRVEDNTEEAKGHAGDEYDLDAARDEKITKKKSWWGRSSGGGDSHKREQSAEDTVGVQEVQTGESGKAVEDQHQQPTVGTIGRLLGRFKKTATVATEGGDASARSSVEQPRVAVNEANVITPAQAPSAVNDSWKGQDFDALGSGQFGAQASAHQPQSTDWKDVDDREEETRGGFFGERMGSGRGSVKSRARVPTAPPEDDFGGLLGAFSTAPVSSNPPKHKTSKPFDPFDPLSEPQPGLSSSIVPPQSNKRPVSSFTVPPPPVSVVNSQSSAADDSFDAFFDSVTASIPKPPLSSIPTPPLPSNPGDRPPSLSIAKVPSRTMTAKRTSLASSPIARMSSASPPPLGVTSPPSAGTSRSTTPVLLAPPPPPSQPLSQRNNLLLGSLVPTNPAASPSNPAVASSVSSSSRPASVSPRPLSPSAIPPRVNSPLPSTVARGPSPAGNTGPLSRDDLDFFENL